MKRRSFIKSILAATTALAIPFKKKELTSKVCIPEWHDMTVDIPPFRAPRVRWRAEPEFQTCPLSMMRKEENWMVDSMNSIIHGAQCRQGLDFDIAESLCKTVEKTFPEAFIKPDLIWNGEPIYLNEDKKKVYFKDDKNAVYFVDHPVFHGKPVKYVEGLSQ